VNLAARACRALVLLCLAGAARPAAAFLRSTTCAGRPDAGYALWWGSRSVTFRFSTARVPSGCADLPTAQALVAQSFLTWNGAIRSGDSRPCTDFAFVEGPATPSFLVGARDGENVVAFRQGSCAAVAPAGDPCLTQGGCANRYNCWEPGHSGGTLAITWVSFSTGSGQITDADTELDDWDGTSGYLFTCGAPGSPRCASASDPTPPGCTWIDVGAVVTHEAGHALGLDHPCSAMGGCSPPSLMAPYIQQGSTLRTLYPDDVEGMCTIYPTGQPTSRLKLPGSCGGSRGCGCGGGPASALWALLPPLLLRRSRLRRSPPRSSRPR
jgi:hypothetical protein